MNLRNLLGLVLVPGLLAMSACGAEPIDAEVGETLNRLAAGDECDTTNQCKAQHGADATDCKNSKSASSVCMCGATACAGGPSAGCTTDAQCGAGEFCRSATGECSAALGDGASCGRNAQCLSDRCVNGTCQSSGGGGAGGSASSFTIGYSADGNQHDWDDIHASPMTLALIARRNRSALVHFDYNNHLGDNDRNMASTHRANVERAVALYGFDASIFFDDQSDLGGAVESIARAVNAATGSQRFYLICAGPMEVCWRGINASNAGNRSNTTVISHSAWNDNHADTSQLKHTWSDIRRTGVRTDHINDQNPPAFNSSCGAWTWLRDVPGTGAELYRLVCDGSKAGDASDAGMTYYVLQQRFTGSSSPSMTDVMRFFGR